jgi:hypothetical protein
MPAWYMKLDILPFVAELGRKPDSIGQQFEIAPD